MGPAHVCPLAWPCRAALLWAVGEGATGGTGPLSTFSGSRATGPPHPPGGKAVGFGGFWGEGTRSLLPIHSRASAVTWLFRFQKRKLEKARKKKEEKKEAMLEKSLFRGRDGAGGAEGTPSPGGQLMEGWGELVPRVPPDPGLSPRHGALRRSGDTAAHHHLTAPGTGSCRAGELWGQCHPRLGSLGGQRWPQ